MKEYKHLKLFLILQSFLPLYFLVIIRCCSEHRCKLILDFFSELFHGNFSVIVTSLKHQEIFATILLCLCILLFISSLFIFLFSRNFQTYGFQEETRKMIIDGDVTENSVVFFVTYITPFVLDDIDTSKGFFCFMTIVVLLFLLMRNTNLYYQNPFLTILGYRSYYFHFEGDDGKPSVAITRGNLDASNAKIIKRKRISDNVYFVYNKS